ncbi:inactive leucine-rich repeat receptor-like serine/threonine-protein kinase At1g60630 [Vigna radiata var. radiata]|uniref:Inactive leucine-rich repeat receptor-like serine/threonine-protein kinase At1g60630 n=1 Tax=Vigna radiata var. radiata TaxID=3916 RepID=A0A1S3TJN4_VIGRR|nr:inactive leucine-rich repeat receptor-like serine/threonine-protein kinase At1g60630 [Vigna radiata var. radiata]XP_014493983.1 inactive leucine-rich repeat receptor-like serine/threonine-protein kinase At1g60630 [Vigna radiata var. radiata]XP_014493985.1 inactive leucine-rich repeat receptor-like serine/threonine-protein kinase At1g60630 [Vigna radiata var. radiata]XP_014493986.1 inactive leucine-rich repeat receptor-like serine/threonine-protein kinase At1g60630 [Vigna radiata var. radiata]
MERSYVFVFLCVSVLCLFLSEPTRAEDDSQPLLALKSSIDVLHKLPWRQGTDVCTWKGVKDCFNGRVRKLVLEHSNLTGSLDAKILNRLDQLRVLSFKGNSLSGQVPDLSALINLKSIFLNDNNFSGEFPSSVALLHRVKVIVLSQNHISGDIPASLLNLRRLYILYLEDNAFTGSIPAFNQTSLRYLNVSNNRLSGEIPETAALIRFNASSFSGNPGLCGENILQPCKNGSAPSAPPISPSYPLIPGGTAAASKRASYNRTKLIKIIGGCVGGFIFILLCMVVVWAICRKRKTRVGSGTRSKGGADVAEGEAGAAGSAGGGGGGGGGEGGDSGKQGGFAWEGEGLGKLVFCGGGDREMSYSLEDLLKASAETLGRGIIGSTYKAVMESGFIVTVKRLKDARYPGLEEFRAHIHVLGRLTHPNLVPLRAYFQAKEERLLVYDYFPNGSLFSLIHGSKTSGGGKPLHWTSCLKIAEDLATGLLYIHQNPGMTHGNLKSSNVLLGSDFESCLTDYGLTVFLNPDSMDEPSATSLFYRAPECRNFQRSQTQPADVYSFGVLVLELLTGKTPFQDLVQTYGSDIPRWVRSVREEETESGDDPASGNEASEEKLQALLNIAMACVSLVPENRPTMREVLKMIRDARGEAHVSSNSSDHSPGRWSDTVQSFPREEHQSI